MIYMGLVWPLTDRMYHLFQRLGWTALNYKQEVVVQGFGLNLFMHYALFIGIMLTLHFLVAPLPMFTLETISLFAMMLFSLTSLGWIDDRWGDPEVKGFKGHFGKLVAEKHMTSGLAKAVFGLLVALVVCWQLSSSYGEFMLFSLALVLSMHIFNLLDVRPGRALKSYWLFSLAVIPFVSAATLLFLTLPVLCSTVLLFGYDRRRMAMLGDTGSMALGGIFGFQLIVHAPLILVAMFVIFFMILTIAAERISISAWIEQHRWLKLMDGWGLVKK
ncbi:glycosyl transferase [Caldalkalibacillus thermarum]|uniref:UDP-N-acetylmuramyl pentapeptide phosphotransferase n=1 Tax=Caldalkalibacillus thermarum TaxID=296745 RepID=UPI00166EC8DE|nr:UDP-N-acetylmuramyl pentapeptide phosphotransferase [Caldalkalibacillus thermarum]GGK19142.1 glycosyl transferase [Caldalkalibacillus thermarum]